MVIYILCLLISSYYVVSESIECMVHTPGPALRWGGGRVEEDRDLLGIHVFPGAGPEGGAGADKNGHISNKK